jgi:hypothetical protein
LKHAWRWELGTRVEVFDDPVGETLVANVPLSEQQRETFEAQGYRVEPTQDPATIEDTEFLLFSDNLFVSPRLLDRFLRACRKSDVPGTGAARLVLAEDAFTQLTGFAGEQPRVDLGGEKTGWAYGLWWVRGGGGDSVLELVERARPVVLETGAREFTIPFSSRLPAMTDLRVSVTDCFAIEITSWVHVWMANLFSIACWLFSFLRTPRGWARLAWCVVRSLFSTLRWRPYDLGVRALGRLVIRGRGCRIHPTAVVEACKLGKNVQIGPLCIVRGSILGDGVNIMEHSSVDGCVLGDGVLINQGGDLKGVTVYPDSVVRLMQTGLVGRNTFIMRAFMPQDMKFQGTIRVAHRGRLIDTGLPFLSVCIGHRVIVGGLFRLAAGRALPNDLWVLTDPIDRVNVVPDDLPKNDFIVVHQGEFQFTPTGEPKKPTRR